ncbi:MAG: alpha/beta hydrolase [Acidiferrobacterales bacterium]
MESSPSATEPPLEIATAPGATASVIWLHGLGADGHDFEPVVPALRLPNTLPVRFVFPHAPTRSVTINSGFVMRAWYDIVPAAEGFSENPDHVRQAEEILRSLVERELSRGIPAARIVLAGFSQGGAIALHTGLRYPQRLAGIMALSAYLALAETLPDERHVINADIPIFMAHGEQDPLIPLSRAQRSRELLQGLGYEVDWHVYPMPHTVCAPEVEDIRVWLNGAFQGGSS